MFRFVVRRLLQIPLILLAVSVITVGLLQLLPPEQRAAAFLPVGSEEQLRHVDIDAIIEQYHLNEGFLVQYGTWVKEALRGNLGFSRVSGEPVLTTIKERLPATLELALFAFFPILAVGIWLGVLAVLHRGRRLDLALRATTVLAYSLPSFVLGIWLLAWLYGGLGLFGIGRVSNEHLIELVTGGFRQYTGLMTIDSLLNGRLDIFWDALAHLFMPVLTLTIIASAYLVRVMRGNLLEELGKDYIRVARAKGLSERAVTLKHASRNALIPVVTLAGLLFASLLSGVVIAETIFDYPGIGQWAARATVLLDVPAVLGFALFNAIILMIVNLVADLLYALVDPRISYA